MALLSDRELTVANVGDSRGVLCDKDGNAVALSHDHKPYQLKERKRIKRAGTVRDTGETACTGCTCALLSCCWVCMPSVGVLREQHCVKQSRGAVCDV